MHRDKSSCGRAYVKSSFSQPLLSSLCAELFWPEVKEAPVQHVYGVCQVKEALLTDVAGNVRIRWPFQELYWLQFPLSEETHSVLKSAAWNLIFWEEVKFCFQLDKGGKLMSPKRGSFLSVKKYLKGISL